MNRGLFFYTPTQEEWAVFRSKALDGQSQSGLEELSSTGGVYLLTSYMPATSLHLTKPNLTWCVDSGPLERHETRINIGSSYFVMRNCILGPVLNYADAATDTRMTQFIECFSGAVSEGLRWILQIYQTTDIIEQHAMDGMDRSNLHVAKNIHKGVSYENYAPVQLTTELSDRAVCEDVPTCTDTSASGEHNFYVQPFGTGVSVGNQFTRPHLGTAPIANDFCPLDTSNIAVRDPYAMKQEDVRLLNDSIRNNRENIVSNHFAKMYTPTTGLRGAECLSMNNTDGNVRCPTLQYSQQGETTAQGEQVPGIVSALPTTQPNVYQSPHRTLEDYEMETSEENNIVDPSLQIFLNSN